MRLYAFVTPIDCQTDVRIPRVKTQLGLQDSADKSLEAYKAASDVAVTELPQTHPIRLGLCLELLCLLLRNSQQPPFI